MGEECRGLPDGDVAARQCRQRIQALHHPAGIPHPLRALRGRSAPRIAWAQRSRSLPSRASGSRLQAPRRAPWPRDAPHVPPPSLPSKCGRVRIATIVRTRGRRCRSQPSFSALARGLCGWRRTHAGSR
ncbi:hypothetical protein PVAP13_3NG258129 [Panicum virgatum]|uniref:Uncharacterized protein n=1 Tax=Panicum virgatum TaxID=38727 RepID=A0A8T0UBB0_PANVG|nr:hypothetical protein PVAP13_3NG258129 [Panicum virgatum]